MLRSLLAVVGGFVLWSVLWLSYNAVLRKLAWLPSDEKSPLHDPGALLMLLAGSVLCSLAAGYLAAWITSTTNYLPVYLLCVVLIAVGIFFQTQVWHLMPIWYHLSFLALLVPATLFGAWLRFR
jgi:hypothetical protein